MTSKEIAIREMEKEIQQKERELNQLQEELLGMKEKLEEYKNIPDSYYDTTLVSCEDFPLRHQWCYRIGKILGISEHPLNVTINELIHSSPKQLLKVSGLGKGKLGLIEDWMEKHDLHFLS
ncbi:MAG: hypothetical protein ACLS90_04745 [Clostridia bacterium]|nr:MAG: hypothetical protein BHW64_04600 [Candidatus Melainabacteria bacterium LEY3_CP_29_8]